MSGGATSSSSLSSTAGLPPSTSSPASSAGSGINSSMSLIITLSTVLSIIGLLLVGGSLLICWRYRSHGRSFFRRGVTPIDDDEIATWKMTRDEKEASSPPTPHHAKQLSTSSVKKPPSVIVYHNPGGTGGASRMSEEARRSSYAQFGYGMYGKPVPEKELPQTPIQARAPNARAGLTDETVPGDDPFLPTPKRQNSRLSKVPPLTPTWRSHQRTRSSRSSTSLRSSMEPYSYYYAAGSELEMSPRASNDYYYGPYSASRPPSSSHSHPYRGHSRVYSSSDRPPRLSFGDDDLLGGLSPRPVVRNEEIGRAIG